MRAPWVLFLLASCGEGPVLLEEAAAPLAATERCPTSIFGDLVPHTISADTTAVEVGTKVRFRSGARVEGVRFYKGPANTGTHVGTFWDARGNALASAVFGGESASGWQEVRFARPVAVAPGTTYVVSVSAPRGGFAADAGLDAQSLSVARGSGTGYALADGEDGPNGVYALGVGRFPATGFPGANYYVDVRYQDLSPPAPIGGLSAVEVGPSSVTLAWSAPGDAADFEVMRDGVAVAHAKEPRFVDRGASPDTAHTYKVVASDACGNMGLASRLVVRTPPVPDKAETFTAFGDDVPAAALSADASPAEPSVVFVPATSGVIHAVRFLRLAPSAAPYVVRVRDLQGSLLGAGVAIARRPIPGWQEVPLARAVPVQRNTPYLASYAVEDGRAAETQDGLRETLHRRGLSIPAAAGANHWVDVRFQPAAEVPPVPIDVAGRPYSNMTWQAWISEPLDFGVRLRPERDGEIVAVRVYREGAAHRPTAVRVWSDRGALLGEAPMTPEGPIGWATIPLSRAVPVRAGWYYVVSVLAEGFTPLFADANHPLRAVAWQEGWPTVYSDRHAGFPTTPRWNTGVDFVYRESAIAPPGEAYSGYNGYTPIPASPWERYVGGNLTLTDARSMELGVRFRVEREGEVRAVRFLRGVVTNAGHVASIWTERGERLACGWAPGGVGWVEAPLDTPLRVHPGVTYVASYFAPNGEPENRPHPSGTWSRRTRDLVFMTTSGSEGIFRLTPTSAFPDTPAAMPTGYYVDVTFAADP